MNEWIKTVSRSDRTLLPANHMNETKAGYCGQDAVLYLGRSEGFTESDLCSTAY